MQAAEISIRLAGLIRTAQTSAPVEWEAIAETSLELAMADPSLDALRDLWDLLHSSRDSRITKVRELIENAGTALIVFEDLANRHTLHGVAK